MAGNFLCIDEPFPGSIRCLIRVKLHIHVLEPLLSGFYLDLGRSEFIWINFRYENLFLMCSDCNRVGHKQTTCPLNLYNSAPFIVDKNGSCMSTNLPARNLSNMNIGLKRTEKFRTTKVNLMSFSKNFKPPQPQNTRPNKRSCEFAILSHSSLKKRKLVPETSTQPYVSTHNKPLHVPLKYQLHLGSYPPSPTNSVAHSVLLLDLRGYIKDLTLSNGKKFLLLRQLL